MPQARAKPGSAIFASTRFEAHGRLNAPSHGCASSRARSLRRPLIAPPRCTPFPRSLTRALSSYNIAYHNVGLWFGGRAGAKGLIRATRMVADPRTGAAAPTRRSLSPAERRRGASNEARDVDQPHRVAVHHGDRCCLPCDAADGGLRPGGRAGGRGPVRRRNRGHRLAHQARRVRRLDAGRGGRRRRGQAHRHGQRRAAAQRESAVRRLDQRRSDFEHRSRRHRGREPARVRRDAQPGAGQRAPLRHLGARAGDRPQHDPGGADRADRDRHRRVVGGLWLGCDHRGGQLHHARRLRRGRGARAARHRQLDHDAQQEFRRDRRRQFRRGPRQYRGFAELRHARRDHSRRARRVHL